MGLYPNRCLLAKYSNYKRCNRLLMLNSASLLLPIMFAIHESTNVVDMGDDMAWMIGVSLANTNFIRHITMSSSAPTDNSDCDQELVFILASQ